MPWQIEAAITDRTAAVACPIFDTPGTLSLPEVAEIAMLGCPGHRRRGRRAPPAVEPAPVHQRRRRPRHLLRRQGDRRAAVERHSRRPRRPDRLDRPAASGHGRAGADVEPALPARLRRDRRSSPSGTRPIPQGRREEIVGLSRRSSATSPAPTMTMRSCGPGGWTSSRPRWARSTVSWSRGDALLTSRTRALPDPGRDPSRTNGIRGGHGPARRQPAGRSHRVACGARRVERQCDGAHDDEARSSAAASASR